MRQDVRFSLIYGCIRSLHIRRKYFLYITNGLLQFRDKWRRLNILDIKKTCWDMVDYLFFKIYSEYFLRTILSVHNVIKKYWELRNYKRVYIFVTFYRTSFPNKFQVVFLNFLELVINNLQESKIVFPFMTTCS